MASFYNPLKRCKSFGPQVGFFLRWFGVQLRDDRLKSSKSIGLYLLSKVTMRLTLQINLRATKASKVGASIPVMAENVRPVRLQALRLLGLSQTFTSYFLTALRTIGIIRISFVFRTEDAKSTP